MVDLNTTISFLNPYFSTVEQVVGTISLLVGGLFGIYLITLIIRLIFLKKTFDIHKEIKIQLNRLEEKIDKLSKKKQ